MSNLPDTNLVTRILHGIDSSLSNSIIYKLGNRFSSACIDIFDNWSILHVIDNMFLTHIDGLEGVYVQIDLWADFGPFANKPKEHSGFLHDYPITNEYDNYGRNATGKIGELVFWTQMRFSELSMAQINTNLKSWYHVEIHPALEKAVTDLKIRSHQWVPFPIKTGILWAPNKQVAHVLGVKLNPEWGNVILDVATINYLCSIASFNGMIIKSEAKTNMFMRPFKLLNIETNEVLAEIKDE